MKISGYNIKVRSQDIQRKNTWKTQPQHENMEVNSFAQL